MKLLRGFGKTETKTSEMAVFKQDGVFSLWKSQSEATYTIQRALASNSLSEKYADDVLQKINHRRLKLQDTFLLLTDADQTKSKVEETKTQFFEYLKQETNLAKQRERNMNPFERAQNLVQELDKQFKAALQAGQIDRRTVNELTNQNRLYFTALKENLENPQLRNSVKTTAAHELIDNYYHNVFQIFSEATSRRKF